MKLLIVGSGSEPGILKNYLQSDSVEVTAVAYSPNLVVENYGSHDELLVIFLYMDSSEDVKSLINNILSKQYAVIYNMSASLPAVGLDISQTMGFFNTSTVSISMSSTKLKTVENNYLKESLATSANVEIQVTNGADIGTRLRVLGNAATGFINLANISTNASQSALGYFPAETLINGSPINGCMIFFGGLTWKPGGKLKSIINDLYTLVKTKGVTHRFRVFGTVSNSIGNPLVCEIYAYRRSDGVFISSSKSDSSGLYSMRFISPEPIYLVCLNKQESAKNGQILDNIIPVEI